MSILVSGGAGYIGSHTCVELLNAGYDIVVADNYYNSCPEALKRVREITGKDFKFVEADMTDHAAVEKVFAENPGIDCVIQFAAYKAVGESVSKPIEYYSNNLNCTLNILDVMRRYDCHNIIIFSSSATVYGDPASVPIREDFPVGATTNPYGTTKVFTERILTDCCKADPELNVALLRYFNPIGAHPSGKIGEDPNGIPNNLVPYIAKVAVGKLEKCMCTAMITLPRCTGVRDYIHVVDLARGHVAAIKKLEEKPGLFICNLGTGHGYSVLDVIHAFSKPAARNCPMSLTRAAPAILPSAGASQQGQA